MVHTLQELSQYINFNPKFQYSKKPIGFSGKGNYVDIYTYLIIYWIIHTKLTIEGNEKTTQHNIWAKTLNAIQRPWIFVIYITSVCYAAASSWISNKIQSRTFRDNVGIETATQK